jgi:hypothetical protein
MRLTKLPTGDGDFLALRANHWGYATTCGYFVSGPTSEVNIGADMDGVVSSATRQLLSETDHVLAAPHDPYVSWILSQVLMDDPSSEALGKILELGAAVAGKGGHALVFGCGNGPYFEALAFAGVAVDGVDSRRLLAQRALESVGGSLSGHRVFVADITGFESPAYYCLAVAGPGIFSALIDEWSVRRHLQLTAESIRPGGTYAVHMETGVPAKLSTFRTVADVRYRHERDIAHVDRLRGIRTERSRVMRAEDGALLAEVETLRRNYSPASFRDAVAKTGRWEVVDVVDDDWNSQADVPGSGWWVLRRLAVGELGPAGE